MLERPEHHPVRSRIRASLQLADWDTDRLASFLKHQIKEAGRPDLISAEVIQALCEQSLGSPRILGSLCAECLIQASQNDRSAIDMDTYLDLGKKSRSKPSKKPVR
jgi:type II secretory pathway predicted ATPase ExeA